MTNVEKALSLCKGNFQRGLVEGLYTVRGLRGKAKKWGGKYLQSYRSLYIRLIDANIRFDSVYGPRGGNHYGIDLRFPFDEYPFNKI